MFERFTKDARAAVHAAANDAQLSGRPAVEAEHLLLALTDIAEIQALGLEREQIAEALIEEERQSLSAVGVSVDHFPQAATAGQTHQPPFGASAKLALERGVRLAQLNGNRRFRPQDLLGGVLAAEQGRVPRALDLAGVDIDELRRRI